MVDLVKPIWTIDFIMSGYDLGCTGCNLFVGCIIKTLYCKIVRSHSFQNVFTMVTMYHVYLLSQSCGPCIHCVNVFTMNRVYASSLLWLECSSWCVSLVQCKWFFLVLNLRFVCSTWCLQGPIGCVGEKWFFW